MNFVYPAFLLALFTIAIPIIIHLFSFRRYKTVYFSHVNFLKDVKRESQKKSRLKQLLILAARILTIIFLVLAFAQPYIPSGNETQGGGLQTVGIYVDNSFSMNALSEQGQLLELARTKAAEIAQSYPPQTQFRLYTNDLMPQHQHRFNREQFIGQISEIETSPATLPVSQINNRFNRVMESEEEDNNGIIYYISDFQRSITDPANFTSNSYNSYFLKLEANQVNNLYIDSSWVEVPAHRINQEENIFVRIRNNSNEDYQNLPLKLYLNDSLKSITTFSVSGQNEIIANLRYINATSGVQLGKIEINDYPFTYDNNWYISYFAEPNINALALFDESPESRQGLEYISALFENDEFVQLDRVNIRNLQMSRINAYNTIFLVNIENFSSGFLNELAQAVEEGISVVLFPAVNEQQANNQLLQKFDMNLVSGTDTVTQKIAGINFDNPFYADVFAKREENPVLPEIEEHLTFRENIQSTEMNLLWFQNGNKALSAKVFGTGNVWVFSFPLTRANESFARDVLFVPTLYKIVINSLPHQQTSYTVGSNRAFTIPRNERTDNVLSPEVMSVETGERFIPEVTITSQGIRLNFGNEIQSDGHYLIMGNDTVITPLAFNYSRRESELQYFSNSELERMIEENDLENIFVVENAMANFSEVFDEIHHGKQLWKVAILLALLFILAEVLIARFLK